MSGTGNSSVAGNLGIGETSPVVPLHVKTTGTGTGDFDNAIATLRSTAAGRTITLQFSDTTNQSYISSKSGALNFGVGGATLGMSLSSGGNLTVSGTGTSTFSSEIAANKSASNISFAANGSTPKSGIWTNNDGTMEWSDYATGTHGLLVNMTNGATVVSGNLTVSGTGTSSVAGAFTVGQTPNTLESILDVVGTGTAGNTLILGRLENNFGTATLGNAAQLRFRVRNNNVGEAELAAINAVTDSVTGGIRSTALAFLTGYQIGGMTEKARFNGSTGNFLLNKTIDSGNGKLQLADHITSAGGIGFGTDTSLYRSQTGMLALDGLTGSLSQLDLRVGGVQKAFVAWNGGDFYLGAVVGTTVIKSSNTTALTLDSSQNATFAGDVGLSGNEKYLNLFSTYSVGSNSRARLRAVGSGGGSGYGGSFTVDTRTSGNTFITALTIDDAQNATFAGQITASGISHKLGSGGTGSANALLTIDGSSASSYGPYIVLQRNSTNKWQFGTYSGINGGTSDDFLLYNPTAANEALKIAAATSNATFGGTIALTGSSAGQVATWNSSNANGIYHTYLTNGTAIGDIGSAAQAVSGSASDFGITSRAGKLVLGTSSAARVTIDTSGNLIAAVTGTAPTLGTNSTMTFELTSNTSLTIKVRGTDGTTRSVALTLA